jgi:hypothetical protein
MVSLIESANLVLFQFETSFTDRKKERSMSDSVPSTCNLVD